MYDYHRLAIKTINHNCRSKCRGYSRVSSPPGQLKVNLEDCQGVRRTADSTRNIQWTTSQQERVALLPRASPRKCLKIPKLADVHAVEAEEVLVEHCENNPC